jgi:hypothetical protein
MVGAWAGHWATLILRLYQLEKTGTKYFLVTALLPFHWCYRSNLQRQCHEILNFCFFHESVSPKPQSIPSGPFRFFSKIGYDIRSSRCTTGVVDTSGKFATRALMPVRWWIFETFEMVLMGYSVAGGKLIHEKKTRSKKSPDTVPLICIRIPCLEIHRQFSTWWMWTKVDPSHAGYVLRYLFNISFFKFINISDHQRFDFL